MAGNKKKSAPFGERVFAVCALLYGSTAFIRLLMGADEYGGVGDETLASPTKRILWLITYVMAGYFLTKRHKSALEALRKMPHLVLLMAYIATSVVWSGSRTISILSVAALAGNSLIGLYFGVRYGVAEFLRLLGWVYGIVALATFLSPILIRDYHIEGGYWIGFFAQKNALAMNTTVGFLVFIMLARNEKKWKWVHLGFCALCAGLILLSGSTTCIIILLVLLCAMICRAVVEKYAVSTVSRALLAILFLACSTMIMLLYSDGIFPALASSETFIGRVGMWSILLGMVRDKLLLGYGYGGFWVFGGPAQTIWDTLRVDPTDASYAHNGYVQLLVDGGIVGLALLLGLLFTVFRKAWAFSRITKNTWPLYFVVFLLLHNLTEGTFVARNNICWLVFVAVMVQLVRAFPLEGGKIVQAKSTYPEISPASA